MNKFTAIFALFVACLLVTDAKAFSVSPIGFKSTIEPGSKQTFSVVVNNNEKGTRKFRVDINSVRSTEDGRRYYESGADPAEFWATAEPSSFSLNAGQSKTIIISFNVPSNAEPGSHPLAFLVASENMERGEIGLTARSAIPLNLIISGEVTERLALRKFESEDKFSGKKIWPLKIELFNEGTVDVQANGWVQVKDMFGKEVFNRPVVLGSAIYPRSLRNLETGLEMPAGLMPGKYTIKLAVQYGAARATIANEVTLWYLPVYLAEIGFVLIFILIVWLWRRRKVCP